jgi:uncharacterized protein
MAHQVEWIEDLGEVDAAEWDALVAADPDGNPFLQHAFLHALQESGSANASTGWAAHHLAVRERGRLVAAAPLYRKAHSYGEYVFDWAWAQALEAAGRAYYPKWLCAVPFTPVAGSRLVAADARARSAACEAMSLLAREPGAESSLHVLFPPPAQARLLVQEGFLLREGIQFHWRNRGYRDFDDFLAALEQPKRKKIRAERRKVREAGIEFERLGGAQASDGDWAFFHRCYAGTYAAHDMPPYLDAGFFARISRAMPANLVLVLASRDGRRIASALGVLDPLRGALYGRFWGATEDVSCLHFECCYYQMIEFAIERGLRVFEGGAQGEHKLARGLDPVPTVSAHWLRDPGLREAVRRYLARERAAVSEAIDELGEHRAFRDAR